MQGATLNLSLAKHANFTASYHKNQRGIWIKLLSIESKHPKKYQGIKSPNGPNLTLSEPSP